MFKILFAWMQNFPDHCFQWQSYCICFLILPCYVANIQGSWFIIKLKQSKSILLREKLTFAKSTVSQWHECGRCCPVRATTAVKSMGQLECPKSDFFGVHESRTNKNLAAALHKAKLQEYAISFEIDRLSMIELFFCSILVHDVYVCGSFGRSLADPSRPCDPTHIRHYAIIKFARAFVFVCAYVREVFKKMRKNENYLKIFIINSWHAMNERAPISERQLLPLLEVVRLVDTSSFEVGKERCSVWPWNFIRVRSRAKSKNPLNFRDTILSFFRDLLCLNAV